MSIFTEKEIAYLRDQRLGRLGTVNTARQPHVVPVSFHYDPETDTIGIGGYRLDKTKKFRDVEANPKAALVVDDLVSIDPWQPRMIEIRGTVETFREGGERLSSRVSGPWLRIIPQYIFAFGIDADPHCWAAVSYRAG